MTPSSANWRMLRCVARRRPHLPIHRRCDKTRAIGGQKRRQKNVIGITVGGFGDKIGTCRRHNQSGGGSCGGNMSHAVIALRRVPFIG